MDVADLLVDISNGREVDRFVFVLSGFVEIVLGDGFRGIDIPVRLVEVDKLDEGSVGISFIVEPVDGFGADDVGGEAFFDAFLFSVANPAGFIANLGVVIGAEPVVEAVVVHAGDVSLTCLISLHLNLDERVVPFAEDGGLVAVFSEELGDGEFSFGKMGEAA